MSRVVVVLGMHRSGTSALTRGLHVLGVDSGGRLLPAIHGVNDKGFWEDADIGALNIQLMSSLGHTWDSLASIEPSILTASQAEPFLDRACAIVEEKTHGVPAFAIKDPRMSRLLPFWREVFQRLQLSASCVIALRNPLAVASSLERRDGFDVVKSVYLWLLHMHRAVDDSQGLPRLIVPYDDLLTYPYEQLTRIATALSLPRPDVADAALREYGETFLDLSLRHAHHAVADLEEDARVPPVVVDFYRLLVDASTGGADLDGPEMADGLRKASAVLRDLGPLLSFARQNEAEPLVPALGLNDHRAFFQVFPHVAGCHSESTACSAWLDFNTAQRIAVELPHGSPTGPIRLDPANMSCVITIESVVVRRASDGEILDSWTEPEAIRRLTPALDMVALPGSHAATFVSTGTDPQLLLPEPSRGAMDQPLVLEAHLRIESPLATALLSVLDERATRAQDELSAERSLRHLALEDAASLRQRFTEAEELLAIRGDEISTLQGEIGRLRNDVEYQRQQLNALYDSRSCLQDEIGRLRNDVEYQRQQLNALYDSRSWRVTAPLRLVAEMLRGTK